MSPLLLVLGGARSGKSAYAERRVLDICADDVLYVATLLPGDDQTDARIAAHAARRPGSWSTVVVGPRGGIVLPAGHGGVLLDGFELALALADPDDDAEAAAFASSAVEAARAAAGSLACMVSSEVGWGIHPETEAGRRFRDRCGAANQVIAASADEVVLVVAGVPLTLRGGIR